MVYECHSSEKTLIVNGKEERIINCYYKCFSTDCTNIKTVVTKHPKILLNNIWARQFLYHFVEYAGDLGTFLKEIVTDGHPLEKYRNIIVKNANLF